MKQVAVILSGCGYLDGAEIRESVLSLLYLDQQGAQVRIFAPDIPQSDVIDHLAQQPASEFRNVLAESARIARSKVEDLNALEADGFDALVIPGGFGVAKNLSDFATKAADCEVHEGFVRAVNAFYHAGKPIAAICIAPAVLAACLKDKGLRHIESTKSKFPANRFFPHRTCATTPGCDNSILSDSSGSRNNGS